MATLDLFILLILLENIEADGTLGLLRIAHSHPDFFWELVYLLDSQPFGNFTIVFFEFKQLLIGHIFYVWIIGVNWLPILAFFDCSLE